jgi:hypothetical protein
VPGPAGAGQPADGATGVRASRLPPLTPAASANASGAPAAPAVGIRPSPYEPAPATHPRSALHARRRPLQGPKTGVMFRRSSELPGTTVVSRLSALSVIQPRAIAPEHGVRPCTRRSPSRRCGIVGRSCASERRQREGRWRSVMGRGAAHRLHRLVGGRGATESPAGGA